MDFICHNLLNLLYRLIFFAITPYVGAPRQPHCKSLTTLFQLHSIPS